jgi:hypothetical protein
VRPVTPKFSPPALPANTMPFQAIGAIGTVLPFGPVANGRLPSGLASGCVQRKDIRVAWAPEHFTVGKCNTARFTPRRQTGPGRLYSTPSARKWTLDGKVVL